MPASISSRSHPATKKLWLRPTLRDVAKEAGVARSTVSSILQDRADCYASKETRQRVFAAAQRLDYQPNALSRALLGQQTFTLGLIARNLIGPTVKGENVAAIERLAQQRGYRILVAAHENSATREATLIRSFLAQHVDGFLIEPATRDENRRLYAKMIAEGMPLVAIDPTVEIDAPRVTVDRRRGAYLQLRHLIELGRREFVLIVEGMDHPFSRAKVEGYHEALREAGIDATHPLWITPEVRSDVDDAAISAQNARIVTRLIGEALASGRRFDAIAASSDSLALGAMRALHKANLRIPHDVAVAGFHDEGFGASLPVSLTTVRHPPDVDRIAFDLLMNQIAGEPSEKPSIVCSPTLVVRESTSGVDEDFTLRESL